MPDITFDGFLILVGAGALIWFSIQAVYGKPKPVEEVKEEEADGTPEYDEEMGFEIVIDGTTRMYGEATTIWVTSGQEVSLRAGIDPMDVYGELKFREAEDHERISWYQQFHDDTNPADVDIFDDEAGGRLINVDEHVKANVTFDCMITDKKNDTTHCASVTIYFEPKGSYSLEQLPLVKLEQS